MSLSHLPKGRFWGTGGRTKVLFAFIVRLQLRSISDSFLLFMPRSIASINSIAFVPYKRLGVVSEFIYGVLNYLDVKYLMRDTCFEYDLLEEKCAISVFRLLNSLKLFFISTTIRRDKEQLKKKTRGLLLHTHCICIGYKDKFLRYWKKKGGIKKNTLNNK